MKTFVATLLAASAYAQSNSTITQTASDALTAVEKAFKGLLADYTKASSNKQSWVGVTPTTAGGNYTLNGTISLDTSYLGVNFVTYAADLSGPAANFGDGTYNYIWFQIEKPI